MKPTPVSPARSAEAVDPLATDGRAVEFYRVDESLRILSIVLLCPVPVAIGLFMVAGPLRSGMEGASAWLLGSMGLLFVVAGPLSMILNLKRVLQNEEYLLLRTDGVLDHGRTGVTLHRWEDLESVVYDGSSHTVLLQYRDGSPVHLTSRYAGIEARELARRLDEVRRKALFNLL